MAGKELIILCSDASFEKTELDPTVYRKELIYPGHFVKKDSRGNVEFELPVDETLLDHWVATFNKMKLAGIEVPVPIEHTTDPEQRRGTVVDLKKEFNKERGVPALYSYIKFRDQSTGDSLSKTTQVSLFSPPDFVDGKGNKYVRPIRHVALTDYPLVPGLAGFEKAIAASLVLSNIDAEEGSQMTIAELADRLGITYEPGAADEDIASAIEEAWNADVPMTDTEDPMGGEDPLGEVDPAGEEDPAMGEDSMDDDMGEEDPMMSDDMGEEDPMMSEELEEDPIAPVSASLIANVARARRTELEMLTRERKITPAVRDKLASKYATSKGVSFALSHSQGDGFDDVIAALSLNKPVFKTGSRTGAQHRTGADVRSPIVQDAENRSKKR